jgi:tetratricopeptide (TPR) repeat protein
MSTTLKVELCPQCGAPAKLDAHRCAYCEAEFIITSLASLERFDKEGIQKYLKHYRQRLEQEPGSGELNLAMGICHLDLGLYEDATRFFDEAVKTQRENPDCYYYQAISIVRGRKSKLLTLNEARKVEEKLRAATQMDGDKATYFCFWLIIKYEFYQKNGLRDGAPTVSELQQNARQARCDPQEIAKLLERVPVSDERTLKLLPLIR